MTWDIVSYQPVSLFSLRPATATASGGKTLITPTAFAIKMALLNASIQLAGIAEGEARFPVIRDLRIGIALPEQIVMIKSFAKVLRETEFKGKAVEKETWLAEQRERQRYPFGSTIAYRELVQFNGPLSIAVTTPEGNSPKWLAEMLVAINYLGKRGSFIQPLRLPERRDDLGERFVEITRDSTAYAIDGTLAMLDDCGNAMTFAHANIYEGGKAIRLGKERVLRHVVLPYRLARSSRGYSTYIGIEGVE
jgi:hypothetical protein